MASDLTQVSGRRARTVLLAAYGVVSIVDVWAQLADQRLLVVVLPLVLMPPLGAYFLLSMPRGRVTVIMVAALVTSWLGDSIPGSPLVAISFFVVTQVGYSLVFAPHWRRSLLARRLPLAAYAVPVIAVIVVVGVQAGPLAIPVIAYGLLVTVMVALAAGVSRRCFLGAVLFQASDIALGYDLFIAAADSPARGGFIMVTYLAGQLLIVLGVIRQTQHPAEVRPRSLVTARR